MAYKEDYSKMDGVWRTISGRRVFIKKGQSLTEAMRESGKFQKNEKQSKKTKIDDLKEKEEELKKFEEEKKQILDEETKAMYKGEIEKFRTLREKRKEIEQKIKKLKTEVRKQKIEEEKITVEQKVLDITKRVSELNPEDITELYVKWKFYNNELEYAFGNLGNEKDVFNRGIALITLDELAKEQGLEVSNSPYSFSSYAFEKGGEITWGSKPMDSYRLSDHWNFESRGEIHCKLSNTKEYTQKLILAKYNGETYDVIKEWD